MGVVMMRSLVSMLRCKFKRHVEEVVIESKSTAEESILHCGICSRRLCGQIYKCDNGHDPSCHDCYIKCNEFAEQIVKRCSNKPVLAEPSTLRLIPHRPPGPKGPRPTLHAHLDHCHICAVPLFRGDHYHLHRCGLLKQCAITWHLTCSRCAARLYKETKVDCKNITFARKHHAEKPHHEIRFAHTMCFCPACNFASYRHSLLQDDMPPPPPHQSRVSFTFGATFSVPVPVQSEAAHSHAVIVLEEENSCVSFTLTYGMLSQEAGSRFFIVDCFGPPTVRNKDFVYKLTVIRKEETNSYFSMKAIPGVYRKPEDRTSTKGCLILPPDIHKFLVQVRIDEI